MTYLTRRLETILEHDLSKKMVLLAGPRQCGKTTLAKMLPDKLHWQTAYYNWDIAKHRKALLNQHLDASAYLWIFDELHKYLRWRNWLKGQYDEFKEEHSILVTGSARLDAYSRGGDSLQGRYYFHRLHPFTLSELTGFEFQGPSSFLELTQNIPVSTEKTLEELCTLSGFPEPLFSSSEKEAKRWRLAYGTRVVQEDIRTLERVQDLDRLELLFDRLPALVGSVLSINNLRQDLEVAFETIRNWISILEKLYLAFRIPPFGAPKIKAVKKEQKLYLWDWSRIEGEAARFENLVALHLLRFVHWMADVEGEKWELRYFRDTVGHEVDFILLKQNKPFIAVEVKTSDQNLDSNLQYLINRVEIPYAFQISFHGKSDWKAKKIGGTKIRILPAYKFLSHLP